MMLLLLLPLLLLMTARQTATTVQVLLAHVASNTFYIRVCNYFAYAETQWQPVWQGECGAVECAEGGTSYCGLYVVLQLLGY